MGLDHRRGRFYRLPSCGLSAGKRLCGYLHGQSSDGRYCHISHIYNKDFLFIKHDVTQFIYVDKPLRYILHFASPASPVDYHEYPIQTLKVGSLGTHKALGLAKDHQATFLLASTSEVYGDPLVHPQPETYWGNVNPIGPRGVYDEASALPKR